MNLKLKQKALPQSKATKIKIKDKKGKYARNIKIG